MRLHHVTGDDVIFLYDQGHEDGPRVGDSYYVREASSDDALVVQLVALETYDSSALGGFLVHQLTHSATGENQAPKADGPAEQPRGWNLGLAIGKVRRRAKGQEWTVWDGWVPSRNVEITRVVDEELLARCGLLEPRHPLHIGTTRLGRDFAIEGSAFEKVNVITALKGMGKSHLAKVLILQLIQQGMPCVVFDINEEYGGLPSPDIENGIVSRVGTFVLSASRDFHVTVESAGRSGLISLFENFDPTPPMKGNFEFVVGEAFDELEEIDLFNESASPHEQRPRPFFTVASLRQRFIDRTNSEDEAGHRAMMARLDRMQALKLFAETQADGNTFQDRYDLCAQKGGALVVDLAHLNSRFAREAFVGATLDMVERVAKERIARMSNKLPFVFFEEAHLYTASERIENLVTRARHLGVTTTFITNMVTQLNEAVLRQVDNLFLMYLPHSDDVRYVSKSASTDAGTVEAFAQRIEKHHAMIVGTASGSYPLVFKVAALDADVDVGGKTKLAFAD